MTWDTAKAEARCGYCDAPIAIGDPILRLSFARFPRCRACGTRLKGTGPDGEPPPGVASSRDVELPPVARARRAPQQPGFDFKTRATGEDE